MHTLFVTSAYNVITKVSFVFLLICLFLICLPTSVKFAFGTLSLRSVSLVNVALKMITSKLQKSTNVRQIIFRTELELVHIFVITHGVTLTPNTLKQVI